MLKVGITGGIGSGKTTVCMIFEVLGTPVFYADDAARTVMNTDNDLVKKLIAAFGNETYINGLLNRKYLAGIVFNNAAKLAELNALVHPAVFRAFDKWVAAQTRAPYVLKEAALLFESDSYKLCDTSILVTAPAELKIARVMARDKVSAAEVRVRMDKQLSDEQKSRLAGHLLVNDETQLLVPQVLSLHEEFIRLSVAAL
ncbi:dephospho-CoA kinase [Hufsiella ginkgonis]|uniref:Dephospho-CoA kinase n=1 Tax=Hufsiella ginkgonis TaxID=2695274 RepID=A0A7K1XY06_9SPHI|nr:dephospho-CoA kinase [Hufsiella ginkgonis]MXV15870.1 dephospho-CoA kinase [Hufsiella ginkgonis]